MNYYNEFDPKAAAWLRELIKAGLIPPGDVDERSILDVKSDELSSYTQCHFFAGIGGWSVALELAGWPTTRPVWTGSCPCQPFSAAGKQRGTADERHLWPQFARLIRECRPPTVFGEQVASKLGRDWLAGVFANLEGMGYAVAGADLCAAGVGAPHIRQRLYWVADAELRRREQCDAGQRAVPITNSGGADGRLEHPAGDGRQQGGAEPSGRGVAGGCGDEWLGHPDEPGSQGRHERGHRSDQRAAWSPSVGIPCLDGKSRRTQPGLCPLAHGVSGRVGRLRGYGNAIVPQVAAAFIEASGLISG